MMTRPNIFSISALPPESKPYHYTECGLDDVYLLNGFSFDELDVSINNVDGLWRAIAANLVTRHATLSPAEIRFLRSLKQSLATRLWRHIEGRHNTWS
jgi:hypothetical protein